MDGYMERMARETEAKRKQLEAQRKAKERKDAREKLLRMRETLRPGAVGCLVLHV